MTVVNTTVRSRGAGRPTHTAAAGMFYWDTDELQLWEQVDAPVGDNWRQVNRGRGVELRDNISGRREGGNVESYVEA